MQTVKTIKPNFTMVINDRGVVWYSYSTPIAVETKGIRFELQQNDNQALEYS